MSLARLGRARQAGQPTSGDPSVGCLFARCLLKRNCAKAAAKLPANQVRLASVCLQGAKSLFTRGRRKLGARTFGSAKSAKTAH